MRSPTLLLFFSLFLPLLVSGQEKPTLDYYLPAIPYDAAIPTPAQYLGYAVGEWHVSHDQLVGYLRELDRVAGRISLQVYGASHEQRPLICLTITAPENQARLDELRRQRRQLADPARSARLNPADFPAVAYMGYSIHGNEASGSHAAMLVAYYLAAAQTPEIEALLKNAVILLDPCFNPDGLQRFASWVNSRRSASLMPDPAHDEFNEPWPGGRTNHYWFDLNRDWLVMQQPESAGRVAIFQDWLPNILTDHHEMGANATFFFQPGVPSRVNPVTPARNQELTARIGAYHARLFSEKKVLFFSKENYDDFYYGKGSTYPDVNGAVGILFEQASSRGSAQMTDNGLLSFPYTIRNHVLASRSTLQALGELRVELNEYLRQFFITAVEEARQDDTRAYLFADTLNGRPLQAFLQVLRQHRVQAYPLNEDVRVNNQAFGKNRGWVVPAEQPNYRLVKAIFGRQTQFTDSIFYDISAWTLPDAFGLSWAGVDKNTYQSRWLGQSVALAEQPEALSVPPATPDIYAYVIESQGYDLPRLLAALHRANLRIQVATKPFTTGGKTFAAGSLSIPLDRQALDAAAIRQCIRQSGAQDVRIHALNNGQSAEGPDLGSSNFATLRAPRVVLVTGRGVNAADAGEIWHLLDTRYGLPPLLLDADRFSSADLDKYNVVILADGNFSRLPAEKLRQFVGGGGTLIATGASLRWLSSNGLVGLEFRNPPAAGPARQRRPYNSLDDSRRAQNLPGAIFEAELDLTHPLCFGYDTPRIPMFQGDTIFVETARNPYATPAVYSAQPLLAGYIHPRQKNLVANAAAVIVGGTGNGRIICFSGNPNFRGFWWGTNRLFANAIFFGNLISGAAIEKK